MKPIKRLLIFSIALVALDMGRAATENVTITPSNLNETVNFYSETAGELHTLTVQPGSGYKFKSGPNLELNPDDLWSKVGTASFQLSDMEDRAKIEAEVAGILVPDGSGDGDGTPQEYPFEITMITKYFKMEFIKPDEDTRILPRNSEEELEIELINAIGQPISGEVAFSTSLGTVEPSTPIQITLGKALANLKTSQQGNIDGKITANATSVDITDDETASGEKETEVLAIPSIEPADGQDGTNGGMITSTKGEERRRANSTTSRQNQVVIMCFLRRPLVIQDSASRTN